MMTSDKQTDISSNVLKESFWVDICGAGNDGDRDTGEVSTRKLVHFEGLFLHAATDWK